MRLVILTICVLVLIWAGIGLWHSLCRAFRGQCCFGCLHCPQKGSCSSKKR